MLLLDPHATDRLILDPLASDWLVLVIDEFASFPAEDVFCLCAAEACVCDLEEADAFAAEIVAAAVFDAGVDCFDSICCDDCENC